MSGLDRHTAEEAERACLIVSAAKTPELWSRHCLLSIWGGFNGTRLPAYWI